MGARLTADRDALAAPGGVLAAAVIFALTATALLSSGEQRRARHRARYAGADRQRRGAGRPPTAPTRLLADRDLVAGRRAGRRPAARTAPGVYRTTEPIPLTGEWKTMIRLHTGNALTALPIYLPADPAIPVEGIPAAPQIERPFGPEQQLLQRERKTDVAGWLWAVAYGIVLAIALGFLALLAWGVHRVSLERERAERRFTSEARRGRARPPAARARPR